MSICCVGGLTLGGGNSYYAARYGFACDNVVRFTIALGDGSIVTASAEERPDLFQTLKGSSNNLGIVTNFDLMAFDNGPNGTIFGGVVLYPAQNTTDQQFQALKSFGDNISNNPYGSVIVISTFFSDTKTPMFMNAYDYTKPGANRSDAAPTFKDFWAIPGNVSDSTGPRNMTSLAHEFEVPKDRRVSFSTLTFKNDIRVMNKAHEAFLKVTETLTADATGDYGLYCLYQPIPTLFTKHGLDKGGNVLGLDRFNETLIMWEAYLKWEGQEQDELFQAQATFLRDEITKYAKSIDADNPWLYLNYADKAQEPLEAYGQTNVDKIQAASKKYDPDGVFQYMVPGGFKISAVKQEKAGSGKSHAGAIAGGVVGGVAAIALAVVIGFFWRRRKYNVTEPTVISDLFSSHLPDPFPGHNRNGRLVAPISTVLFVPKNIDNLPKPAHIPDQPKLPSNGHWTDAAPPGSVVIMQLWKPDGHSEIVSGLLGDIVGNRYKKRGVKGAVVDGRSRDVQGVNKLGEDGGFQAWTRGLTSVGTGEARNTRMEAKPWAVDIPLQIGQVEVKPGDIIHADEGERVVAVIPRDLLHDVATLLPRLKNADDAVLDDVVNGADLKKAFGEQHDRSS
ncbi:hypothetical protein PRZ48_009161 [Zasmidium cellare]|uniref:Uncharacterized protein n=1 Tax=Zasmidium cellare TaxID=395010 RepID=A0ABR0EBL5_ZASCE|nr:hypothetical protein PRZ48_009161 [Zasmidium cellare]